MPTREMPQFLENGSTNGRFSLIIGAIFDAAATLQPDAPRRVRRYSPPSVHQLHRLPPNHSLMRYAGIAV